MSDKLAEVRRLLDRYLKEVVETYGLCPWARATRTSGELSVEVLWGTPSLDEWEAAARRMLALPSTRVAMVIAPELGIPQAALRDVREQISRRIGNAGVADFHPDAELDLATPHRMVPFARRSPDPLLQLVPIALLDAVRRELGDTELPPEVKLLGAIVKPRDDVGDKIAATNHARVSRDREQVEATLADIAADRRRSYPRVGISINTSR